MSALGYRLGADLVLLVHLAFVLFVALGGLWVWRRPRVAWLHLPAALWGAGIELLGSICPLTHLEVWLRRRAGAGGYEGGCIEHYVVAVLYPEGLTREIQVALGLLVLVGNGAVYGALLRRRWLARQATIRDSGSDS